MKVYVVTSEWACEDGNASLVCGVYLNPIDAKTCMKKHIKANHLPDNDVIEENENSYCEYVDGEYSRNHYSISITKKDIE